MESQIAAVAFLSGHQRGATFPGAAENSVSLHELSSGHDNKAGAGESRKTGERGRFMFGDKAWELSAQPPALQAVR